MNTKSIVSVAVLSAFLAFSTDAWAGPGPGKYRGKISRTAAKAKLKTQEWSCQVSASNPAAPLATYSTLVKCSARNGSAENLKFNFEVQDNGNVDVMIQGKLQLADGSLQFEASGTGPGTFTEHSFATVIPKGNLSGPGGAKISVSAASPVKGEIEVELQVQPTSKKHRLGKKGYKVKYKGKLKT